MANNYKKMTPSQHEHWNEYQRNYAHRNFKSISIKLSLTKDQDVINFFASSKESATDLIREMVRERIKYGKDNN